MTISSTASRVDYVGDGSTTAFPVTFPFFDNTELRVISRMVATGAETLLALGTNYTVSGGAGSTGTVTAVAAPASTVQWSILRNTRRTQDVDYQPNDSFPAETHERALDRVVAVVQEIEREALRSLRVAETDSTSSLTLPSKADRAARVLAFDVNGNPVASVPEAGSLVVTAYMQTVLAAMTADLARDLLGAVDRAGFRNLIINGNPMVNQRGYVSGTPTTFAGQFTLDRWRVITSGQSVSWTDSAGIRTVTAPAGGMEQVIEGTNLPAGTYTVNWTGTATCTVNGSAVAKKGQVTLTGGATALLRMINGTWSELQIERGTVATPFEYRPLGVEIDLCQRYGAAVWMSAQAPSAGQIITPFYFPSPMRATPTREVVIAVGAVVNATFNADPATSERGGYLQMTASTASGYIVDRRCFYSAEI